MSTHNVDVSPDQLVRVAEYTTYRMVDDRGLGVGDSLRFRAVEDCRACAGEGEVGGGSPEDPREECSACRNLGRIYTGSFVVLAIAEMSDPDSKRNRDLRVTKTLRHLSPAEQLEADGDLEGAKIARQHEEMQHRGERVAPMPMPIGERDDEQE